MSGQQIQISREEACQLPIEERLQLIHRVRAFWPQWHEIEQEITLCHDMSAYAAESPCLLIVGPEGVGKTTLLDSYLAKYPPEYTDTGVTRPIIKTRIPNAATEGKLVTAILEGLGDPRADKGTITNRTFRITQFFQDCGVELVMLDELQHFRDRDGNRLLMNATNWLKNFIKDTGVAFVLVGSQGEAEEVIECKPAIK